MKIVICGPVKIKQNKRISRVRICRPITSTTSCTSAYLTEDNEIFNTESGECLIIN